MGHQILCDLGGIAQFRNIDPAKEAGLRQRHVDTGHAVQDLVSLPAAHLIGAGKLLHELRMLQCSQCSLLAGGGGGTDHAYGVGVHGIHDLV